MWCSRYSPTFSLSIISKEIKFSRAQFGKQVGVQAERVFVLEVGARSSAPSGRGTSGSDCKTIKLEVEYRYEPRNLKHDDVRQVERVKSVVYRPQGCNPANTSQNQG